MGKYYTINGNNLYIYVTGSDLLLDLRLFPKDIHLFDSESAWRMTERIAVVNGAKESDISKAEIILNINAYRALDQPEAVLEAYFTTSDESVFDKLDLQTIEDEFKVKDIQKDFEVIIPEAITPTVDYTKIINEAKQPEPPSIDEDAILEKVLKRIDENLGNQKPVNVEPQLPLQNMVPVKAFEETIELFNRMLEKISATPDSVSRVEESLEVMNKKLSEYILDNRRIQEKQLEAWNTSLDRLTGILAENVKPVKVEDSNLLELEKKIDELLGVTEPVNEMVKPELVVEERNPLEGILASLLNKSDLINRAGQTTIAPLKLQTIEMVDIDTVKITSNLQDNYRYIAYSKYFPEIEQRTDEALEYLESSWNQIKLVIGKIAENPQTVDIGSLPEIDRMTPEEADRMIGELEKLRGRVKGMDTQLSTKLEKLLQKLENKKLEKTSKSPYDIPENRLLKMGIQHIHEKSEALLTQIEYSTQYIRKALKSADYKAMESLAQSLLDNRRRLQTAHKIKDGVLNTLNGDSLAFLDEVEPDWEIQDSSTLSGPYSLFYDLLEEIRSNNSEMYEIKIQAFSENPPQLYKEWCFTQIVEEVMQEGYVILDDNMMEIGDNIAVKHEVNSVISLIQGNRKIRVYYNESNTQTIILESLESDEIKDTIKFHPSLAKQESLRNEEDGYILTPNEDISGSGLITLAPGISSKNLKEMLSPLL